MGFSRARNVATIRIMPALHGARVGLALAVISGCSATGGVAARHLVAGAGAAAAPTTVPTTAAGLDGEPPALGELRGLEDTTAHGVGGARLVPASLEDARVWGAAPGGGVRAIVAGLRIVSSPAGDILAAFNRLPANPSTLCELPERLGGGFLMALGTHLWIAKTWLGAATPLFTMPAANAPSAITELLIGLDRVYLRSAQGPLVAIDPRTGTPLDLGPLPASPRIASIAALDAWRAIAIADLRGALLTLDAGSSWRPVALPIEPARAVALDAGFAVVGLD